MFGQVVHLQVVGAGVGDPARLAVGPGRALVYGHLHDPVAQIDGAPTSTLTCLDPLSLVAVGDEAVVEMALFDQRADGSRPFRTRPFTSQRRGWSFLPRWCWTDRRDLVHVLELFVRPR